ncbi:MAG: alanine--tRNA ligase, partial [Chloroflexota bacterium]
MQAADIRQSFLDFFQGKEHLLIPSSSLIPAGDPTLLLTSAGMVQFKPYFTGEMAPPQPRLASVQKCFRISDVDSVGDTSHLTFFEMLGNFSIGDYFKKEAIAWAWEFVTQHMKLPPERLWVTVFRDDDEAHRLWQETGIPAWRIRRFDEKDNFWGPAGDEGPCGPCSEIHYDFGGPCRLGKPLSLCGPNCECGRFLELWNLVFTQFYQDKGGKRTPLPRPNIDTGMGLERAAMILQGKASIYEIDLFVPIVQKVADLAGKEYGQDAETDRAIRVVAEHARSAAFLIADGVVPDNKGRGYVLRRLIRRAIRFGRKLGLESGGGGFLSPVADVVIEHMGGAYPELASGREFILRVLQLEEERFGNAFVLGNALLTLLIDYQKAAIPYFDTWQKAFLTLVDEYTRLQAFSKGGLIDLKIEAAKTISHIQDTWRTIAPDMKSRGVNTRHLERASQYMVDALETFKAQVNETAEGTIANVTKQGVKDLHKLFTTLSSYECFDLFDTYGFPVEVTAEIAREHGLEVDMEGFQREMESQRQRARAAGGFGGAFEKVLAYHELGVPHTRFLGYETTSAKSDVVGLLVDGVSSDIADEGQQVEVVLRETPFYAEGGGQAGDTGVIEGPGGSFRVEDTQSPIAGLIIHKGRMEKGTMSVGEPVTATVDRERRMDLARNHTATHLLHAALRQVLGTHVRQQGSLVAPDRLRFDFTHVSPLTPEELQRVEEMVNDRIRANVPVHKWETTYRQAVSEGALAFFGERYGDRVRVVQVPVGATHALPFGAHPSTSSGRTEEKTV